MPLLTPELRSRLPPRFSQEAEDEPFVYGRFFLEEAELEWFAIEGQPEDDDYLFFGFVTGPESGFREFRLSELERQRNASGRGVQFDRRFRPGRLADVVPARE